MFDVEDAPLGYLLSRIATELRSGITVDVLEPLGLTFPQFVCLRIVDNRPGMSNAEMSRYIGVSPQAMNIVVRALQDRELITRPSTVAAGRSRPTELTKAGRTLLSKTVAGIRAADDALLADLTEAQRRAFRQTLITLLPPD
ncbi:MarR family transcriptional regulator [Mycobacterium sp. CBMA293]|uniref:MarR family winged helix-turn-helix transcriptional regulator n=1 Tax=unclassified Mycolicibacterium TaxID=2636767 RepID=UPI0012DEFAE3|nr:MULTISPECIES: MarR family transcriptional regulator [unclassified Mycolicibacterium]MUL44988.1 MarR family transcriptional regulator [Mycolicibacterium sp. CBMA 360]MUL57903.1 MarR family transcriptional regulator [Mycolicibacterium sp. CBMA 335]MUL72648.1 MarR family transcriptional regulator [Mycolicibacterium sp. CBMA 311]MUL95581.1 MarR family transcriptional regulator [Mycolicibacterium sp. CBMA 230]MUM07334.1 MarR family transcriptional regulator [Mycolicibacterium sp. CBMA 213]